MKRSHKQACLRHLQDTFGLTEYRPGQKAAVETLLSGRDVMCILPTGAGKSLCWQLPALVHEGLTVVVSPLIALMRDQVQHLAAAGVSAVSLDSLMSPEERARAYQAIRQGQVCIVLVSPERLEHRQFRQLCREMQPWLVVVDEAHCVLRWGEHFRPAYSEIADFLHVLPNRPVLCAMTATADKTMQRGIREALGMRREKRILLPIIRENLVYEARTTLDKTGNILCLCRESPCKTVIFCDTRARTERLAEMLSSQGIPAEHYHAGLEKNTRLNVQERFREGTVDVLCATSAFGMGVDIPDIRRVIHDHPPEDLIDYVQQSGRAGRDGQPSQCILFFEPNELLRKTRMRMKAKERMPHQPIRRWMYLRRYWRGVERLLTVLLASRCIPAGIAAALGKRIQPCGQCSACKAGRRSSSIPRFANMSENQMRAWFLCWQRDALAKKRQCPPEKIVADHALNFAAKWFVFPEGTAAPPEMERLLAHFRGEWMHDPGSNGI